MREKSWDFYSTGGNWITGDLKYMKNGRPQAATLKRGYE